MTATAQSHRVDRRTDTGIRIDRVAAGEHERLDDLITAAYEHDYGPRQRDGEPDPLSFSRVRAERFDVWVAREISSGALLGSVTTPRADGEKLMEDSTSAELDFRLLAVSVDARRRGIGAALTRHVLHLARERGFRAVFMKSAPNMHSAHRLYESLGFRRDPARDGLIIGGCRVRDLHAFVHDELDAFADHLDADPEETS